MSAAAKPGRPPGVLRVVIVNTALLLIAGGIAWMRHAEGHTNVLAIIATAILVIVGPGLLIRHPLVWRIARPLTYVFAMVLSLLVAFAIFEGQFAESWLFYVLLAPVVFYLIGVRGYLSGAGVMLYYGVPVPAAPEGG